MWNLLNRLTNNNDNGQEISFFDVKTLYDVAYEEKAKARVSLKKFKKLIEKALELDLAYRAQLMKSKAFSYRKAA